MSEHYNYAFLDEGSKKEIRRKILKAVAIPGYQVPFASREMPIARGWGTGGLQITLSILGPEDCVKVIDQGSDDSVNAVNIRRLIVNTSNVDTTDDTLKATIIQTRHRIPEEPLKKDQIMVFQVPLPEPLREVEASETRTRIMHAEKDYSAMWLKLYEDIVKWGSITIGNSYPCMVNDRYIFSPSPIPKWDVPKLNGGQALYLFGAGREKKIYAIPSHTKVEPLSFEDYPFKVEDFKGASCRLCGSTDTFLSEIFDDATGEKYYQCSDTSFCMKRQRMRGKDDVKD